MSDAISDEADSDEFDETGPVYGCVCGRYVTWGELVWGEGELATGCIHCQANGKASGGDGR